jgi:hypothetical protein
MSEQLERLERELQRERDLRDGAERSRDWWVEQANRVTGERDNALRQLEMSRDCGGERMGPYSMPVRGCGACQHCLEDRLSKAMREIQTLKSDK